MGEQISTNVFCVPFGETILRSSVHQQERGRFGLLVFDVAGVVDNLIGALGRHCFGLRLSRLL